MDRMFDAYAQLLPVLYEWFARRYPKENGVSDFAHRQALKAKAFDTLRGLLPSAATSNLGIYGSGQGYEALLLRMRAHPLPEARDYADLMLTELRKVIPSWVRRVDVADRGSAWSTYMSQNESAMTDLAEAVIGEAPTAQARLPKGTGPTVKLLDWDPDAEVKLVTAMLYPYTHLSEEDLAARVSKMTGPQRREVMAKYAGDRLNRRHRPGRALERSSYRFDVVSDYGAFRDLQRHRLLTIEWQGLTPYLGYTMPEAVAAAGGAELYEEAMARSASLYEALGEQFGSTVAAYAVTLAHRVRYSVQMNAREAMHMLELRTTRQGHPEYRRVCQKMHDLIAKQAGHRAIAAMMGFVDHADYDEESLGRLPAERRAEARRRGQQQ
jgi:thymidylate synthase ThyX